MIITETLPEVSFYQSQILDDATAFIFEGRHTSYRSFELQSNQVAQGLLASGLQKQSRVALLAKDSDHGYELVFGCAKAGMVLVGLNWKLSAQEVLYILQESESEMIFIGEEFFPILHEIQHELPKIRKVVALKGIHQEYEFYESWRNAQPNQALGLNYRPEDPVLQMYTSGTTGRPKGVLLAHYTFFRLLQGMAVRGDEWMALNPTDNLLICVPMFHIGGLWWGIQGFIAGARGIILESFVAWKALETIQQYHITKAAMVPAMIQFCLSEPSSTTADLSSLKAILYGGSPMTPTLLRNALQVFTCDFYQIYGMTETGNMAVCLRPQDHTSEGTQRRNVAGKPLPGVQVKIIDTLGKELAANEVGEICLRSPACMLGYWKNEEATQETMQDGWIRTGDGGYVDEDGYVYVSDRIKDMIICAGENIFPAEIEAVIAEHPSVAECAVIGIPDDLWGESIKAFVVLRPDATVKPRELINFVRAHMADFKVPKSVSIVATLPRNSSGKLLKRMLRIPYWEGRERLVN